MKKLLFILICKLSIINCLAQDKHLIDSLETKLKKYNEEKLELRNNNSSLNDTTAVRILNHLAYLYNDNNPDKGLEYAGRALTLAEQIDYKRGLSNAYTTMGGGNYLKANYLLSLEFHKKALKVRQEMGDKTGIAGSYHNIGLIYLDMGKFPEALKNIFAALIINEETGNKLWQSYNYDAIGSIYETQGNHTEALKNHLAALKLEKETGTKAGMSSTYISIGSDYLNQGNFAEALKNYSASLTIAQELGEKKMMGYIYDNIGGTNIRQKNYPEALKNLFAAIKIEEETSNRSGITSTYINIGEVYRKEKKFNEAGVYLDKALALSKEIGSLEFIRNSYYELGMLDSARGNYKQYIENYKQYINYRDSLVNAESTKKTVQMQMNYDFNKKTVADSVKSSDEKKIIAAELKAEHTKSYALYGGLALMVLVASVFLKQRNKIGKEKKRSDDLLLNILPAEVADELKETGGAKAKQFDNVSVLFTDFVGFTLISEKLSPTELVEEIHHCFTAFDAIIERNGLEKIKTIGDAYLAVCGMPIEDKDHAKKTVNAALEIMEFINKREIEGGHFKIRIGINSGPVVAGIVGVKKFAYDIWGDTVNTAARMEQHSTNGKINISGATYELVKNDFKCEHRGKIAAKNKGEVDMYFVEL